ncbi:hypothetical protein J6590_083306 [Homalodisca vitripennis]|nr:hypothetical protein J6590_083306 [Homalodisca vitripennis]
MDIQTLHCMGNITQSVLCNNGELESRETAAPGPLSSKEHLCLFCIHVTPKKIHLGPYCVRDLAILADT